MVDGEIQVWFKKVMHNGEQHLLTVDPHTNKRFLFPLDKEQQVAELFADYLREELQFYAEVEPDFSITWH